jgi:hypothetical protein
MIQRKKRARLQLVALHALVFVSSNSSATYV